MNSSLGLPRLRLRRAIECALLFAGLPAMHAAGWIPIPILLVLIAAAGGCWIALRWSHEIHPSELLHWQVPRQELMRLAKTYILACVLLLALLRLADPAALFSLVRERPFLWLLVMFAYPLASVIPQEIVYRLFFFRRYHCLFGSGWLMVAASAAAFSFAHIVFHNGVAIALTAAGGLLFAYTYRRTSSVACVALEHAFYGWALFTLGYGKFLIGGTLRLS